MNIEELYKIQSDLDQSIAQKVDLPDAMPIVDYKYIAWKVEIAEFLNEVAMFKYWKNSHKQNKKAVLEELVDTVHFILSIGNERNYNKFIKEVSHNELYKMEFNVLTKKLLDNPMNCSSDYMEGWAITLAMAFKLGFSEQDIKNAYLEKNKINYERQKRGY